MALITKERVKEAIGLGTLNPKILNDFFYDIKLKSYDYDYLIQEDLVDLSSVRNNFYTECFMRNDVIQDGYRDGKKDRVCILQVDKDIVHYAMRKRYKTSKIYNKPQTLKTMMNHRDLFKFGVLCFINGRLDLDFRIQAREDKTFVMFPYSKFVVIKKDTDTIDTVFIPESVIYQSRGLTDQDKFDNYSIKDFVFEDFKVEYMRECKGFMAFITPKDTSQPSIFQTDVKYSEENRCFTFKSLPATLSNFTLTIIGMEDYSQTVEIDGTTKFLQIERKKMPIPKKNILIMVRDDNGYSYHVDSSDITIKEYYPNIYEVINPKKLSAKLIVLYKDNPQNDLIDYDVEIDYYLSKVNLLERYQNGTVPDGLKEYYPVKWDYLISDYEETSIVPVPIGDAWYPFLYKLNKISSVYKLWCLFFQTYLQKTYGFLDGWTLDISTIDLVERERLETVPELPMKTGSYKKFKTPQYLFTYRNDWTREKNIPYAWFIDGRYAVPTYSVAHDGYQYVYFDKTLIKEDSVMEIERYDGNVWTQKVQIGNGPTEVVLTQIEKHILANSIFLTDENEDYISNTDKYKISIKDASLGDYEYDLDLEKSVYILNRGDKIIITALSDEDYNKTIHLNVNNQAVVYDAWMNWVSMFDEVNINQAGNINRVRQNIMTRLRVYSPEGRRYPSYALKHLTVNKNIGDLCNFTIMANPETGTPFKVEYMGYDEKRVYDLDEIPANGLINLEGKLNKPFSLTYHDVFLNGYKLSKKNIEIISPFWIILKNVNTVKGLEIYERTKGEEIFGFETDEASQYIADRLLTMDKDFYDKLLEDLVDIVVDPSEPDMEDQIDIMIGFIKDFIAINFVNGDTLYTPEEFAGYDELFKENWRLYLNADDRVTNNISSKNWFYLSHDRNILYQGK